MTQEQINELKWIMAETRERIERGFYGEIVIKLNAGRIVNASVQESIKPVQHRSHTPD